jgi:hypothetical protein
MLSPSESSFSRSKFCRTLGTITLYLLGSPDELFCSKEAETQLFFPLCLDMKTSLHRQQQGGLPCSILSATLPKAWETSPQQGKGSEAAKAQFQIQLPKIKILL